MVLTYEEFIARKRIEAQPVGFEPREISGKLFPFQRDVTQWACRRGRAALFLDTGLGKSWCAIEWAREVVTETNGTVLILTPLAVAQQFVREGEKIGVQVRRVFDGAEMTEPGIYVTNYDRMDRFELESLAGIVLDESSCLKSYDSKTRTALINRCQNVRYRLACTATPAPNDHQELGNHAEFLGIMTRLEMLSMFFEHDGGDTSQWYLKGHARKEFWRWVSSWAVCLQSPADLGYDASAYVLPELQMVEHTIDAPEALARKPGELFASVARTLSDQRAVRKNTMGQRIGKALDIIGSEPGEQWVIWAELNSEQDEMAKALGKSCVSIYGSLPADEKEARHMQWLDGKAQILISKASVFGFGLNWQHCARMLFLGYSNSFESFYQSVRRVYRFGQKRPVQCHMIGSTADGHIVANLKRKQDEFVNMRHGMVEHMIDTMRESLGRTTRQTLDYTPSKQLKLPSWL